MRERQFRSDDGQIFRKGAESALCRCSYDLTMTTDDQPALQRTRTGWGLLKGGQEAEIDGTVTPARRTAEVRAAADKAGYPELLLDDDGWLDVQFIGSSGNRVRGANLRRQR